MHLSKAAYYADFVVYPVLLLPLGAVFVRGSTWQQQVVWILSCLIGIAGCTLLEYVVHRIVLHHIPPFRGMHDLHHATPIAMVGTPTWLSTAFIGGGVLLPLWWQAGLNISSGLTFGLILGYLWYVLVHHAIHRWRARYGSYLYRAKRRHSWHHQARQSCNFGVTTDCWDRCFGSTRVPKAAYRTDRITGSAQPWLPFRITLRDSAFFKEKPGKEKIHPATSLTRTSRRKRPSGP